jgi:hypothetical protein
MKDDSKKDLLMMSLVQSLCLQGNCLEGDTADDQFTFGRRAILSINDIERILVELVKPYKQNRG